MFWINNDPIAFQKQLIHCTFAVCFINSYRSRCAMQIIMMRLVFFIGLFTMAMIETRAQCGSPISSFPYTEEFESSSGGWTPGGFGNDWAWGTPAKAIINTAGGGTKCWITGGLTGNAYTNGEA